MRLPQAQAVPSETRAECILISRILAGERRLYHDLVRPYEIAVYLTAFSVVCNAKEAETTAQRAVWDAFRDLRSLKPGEHFKSFLLKFALDEANCARGRRRSASIL